MQQFMRKFVLSIALTIGFAMSVPSSAKAQVMGPGGITVLRPSVPATATLDPRQALPVLNSLRNGQGWAFATTKTDPDGTPYVKYRIVTGISGATNVAGHPRVIFTTAPETPWIRIRSISLPTRDGSAAEVARLVKAYFDRGALAPSDIQATMTTLPDLVRSIHPTLRRMEPPILSGGSRR